MTRKPFDGWLDHNDRDMKCNERSQYNGCRRCGEQMERLWHRSKYLTKPILQSVVKLLTLLSVLPCDMMV
jgi:hypothetical protein